MSIIFFGTPDFSIPSLKALIHNNETVALIVTQPDRKSGRGRKKSPPPVKIVAREQSIPYLQPEVLKDGSLLERFRSLAPEFIVVVAYGKILQEEILSLPEKGCVNVHASLLPKYRGAAPIQWALIKGEKVTGITTILMDQGMDTGDVFMQKEVDIKRSDTADLLGERLSKTGAVTLIETLKGIRNNKIKPLPQKGAPSYAPVLEKGDGRIDWKEDAESLFNFVRGMYPWPCAYSYYKGKYVKILHSEPTDGSGDPGEIVKISRDRMFVGTGLGLLAVTELQPEGKKPLDARSFVNGYRVTEGDTFE